jgi:hypothetical protein
MDATLRKLIAKHCPTTERLFFGRRYLVPQYRQVDYADQDLINSMEVDRLIRFSLGEVNHRDEMRAADLLRLSVPGADPWLLLHVGLPR